MPLFGPAHPSPIRVQCDTVDGFLLAYRQNSNLKQVDPFPAVVKYVEKQLKRGKSKKPQKPVKIYRARTQRGIRVRHADENSTATGIAQQVIPGPCPPH